MSTNAITVLFALLCLSAAARSVPVDPQVLSEMDREVSGLLDAYLEAVPECPARPDTPLRLWVLDLAWLRAGAAIDSVLKMDPPQHLADSQMSTWVEFVNCTGELFDVYTTVQRAYHGQTLPDSSECILLEDSLIRADSIWCHSERVLLELLSEEGNG